MFICEKNYHCVGCGYEYADDKSDIDAEYADCEHLIEVAPVVRCKDCKSIRLCGRAPFMVYCCGNGKGLADSVDLDDFCSYGERKEQGNG